MASGVCSGPATGSIALLGRLSVCSSGVAEFDALGLGGEAAVGADAAVVDARKLGRLGPAAGVAAGVGEPAARAGVHAPVLDAAEVPQSHRRPWWRRSFGGNRARYVDVDLVKRPLFGVASGGEPALVVGAGELDVPAADDSSVRKKRLPTKMKSGP